MTRRTTAPWSTPCGCTSTASATSRLPVRDYTCTRTRCAIASAESSRGWVRRSPSLMTAWCWHWDCGPANAAPRSSRSRGATDVVPDIDDEAARQVARRLAERGTLARAVRVDVADQTEVAQLVEGTVAQYGR